jgi:hypothetical protein
MPRTLERCVKKLQKKGYSKNSAYAICSTSTGYKRAKDGKWRKTKK